MSLLCRKKTAKHFRNGRLPPLVRLALMIVMASAAMLMVRPSQAQTCSDATVSTQAELDTAITNYNTFCGDGDTLTVTVEGTITLASALTAVNNSTTAALDIVGDGDDILDGANSFQILRIQDGNVTLETMTLQQGDAAVSGFGGALEIFSAANVTVNNSTFTGHQAPNAGAISSTGTLAITNSTFFNNASNPSQSSVIQVEGGGQTTITNSTFANNQAGSLGTVTALGAGTTLDITNSTFSDNIAGLGVGGNLVSGLSATVNVNNTILANSTSDGATSISDCFIQSATVNFSAGLSNIVENGNQCGTAGTDYIQEDPLLDALQDNGGGVQTMLLLPGSPAIDAGDNTAAASLSTDARGAGFPRILDGTVDLGATENADLTSPQLLTLSPSDDATNVAVDSNLTIILNESVQAGTGDITLYEFVDGTITGDTLVEAFNPAAITAGLGTTTNTNDTITLNPTANLDEETNYYVIIDAVAITDDADSPNAFAGLLTVADWNFITGDFTKPEVMSLTPLDEATNVTLNQNLIIEFDENIAAGTGNITLYSGAPQALFNDPLDDASLLNVTTGSFFADDDPAFDPDAIFGVNDGLGGGDFGGDTPADRTTYNGFTGGFLEANGLTFGGTNPAIIEWQNIDITGATSLQFKADFASALQPDTEDSVTIEAIIDGGSPVEILHFGSATPNGVFRANDSGTLLTDTAQTFQRAIVGMGTSLTIRVILRLSGTSSSGDDIAIDNVIVTGGGVGSSTLVEQVTASDGNVSIVDHVLTFDPTANLGILTNYYVTVEAGAVTDASVDTNDFAGLLDSEWNFTTGNFGSLTVIKEVINDNGGTAGSNDFGLQIGSTAVSSGQGVAVPAGQSVTLNETGLSGYQFVSITGDAQCPADLGGSISVEAGDDITCTLTNNDIAPQLTVIKTVINDNGGTAVAADFTMNVAGTNVSNSSFPGNVSGTVVTLDAGSYVVSETGSAGYGAIFPVDCIGSIAIGENKTCTVANDDIAPTITVTKVIVPASDSGVFSLTIDAVPHGEGGDGTSTGAIDVNVGTRTVGETGASGTDLADYVTTIGGDCAADGSVTVALGDSVSCTITNTRRGTITIKKVVSNAADAPSGVDFAFASDALGAFSLQDQGEQVFSQLPAGSTYSLSETVPPNWTLTDASCSSTGSSVISPLENGLSIELAPADELICTFTNRFDDGDSLTAAQEDGVPGYDGSAQGDGNGDGIADKLQATVSSVQNGSCWWTLASDGQQHSEVQTAAVPADVS
ncbi:MAG: Ig-like domain-containing protein, partial [Candidatus Competibacteraceae bacterium]|nr:Ig-like domain-containing protein [Candidatus Competibacteraceae bacterium]